MYKLAKFRKGLKEKSKSREIDKSHGIVREISKCFYAIEKYENGFITRSAKVRWDSYHKIKKLVSKLENPGVYVLFARERATYGQ
ncbi:hypothetical protein NVP1278O_76 [Vibrio phage 1.278.O._10N.286.54.E8]|nr:hypothetical protein NVP1278O_76 [Vibrio phage 1.278.O._10N.286.54.E8]